MFAPSSLIQVNANRDVRRVGELVQGDKVWDPWGQREFELSRVARLTCELPGPRDVRNISNSVAKYIYPTVILKGAFGGGRPNDDTCVMPEQKVMVAQAEEGVAYPVMKVRYAYEVGEHSLEIQVAKCSEFVVLWSEHVNTVLINGIIFVIGPQEDTESHGLSAFTIKDDLQHFQNNLVTSKAGNG